MKYFTCTVNTRRVTAMIAIAGAALAASSASGQPLPASSAWAVAMPMSTNAREVVRVASSEPAQPRQAVGPQTEEDVRALAFYASPTHCSHYMGGMVHVGESATMDYSRQLIEALYKTGTSDIEKAQKIVWANCARMERAR